MAFLLINNLILSFVSSIAMIVFLFVAKKRKIKIVKLLNNVAIGCYFFSIILVFSNMGYGLSLIGKINTIGYSNCNLTCYYISLFVLYMTVLLNSLFKKACEKIFKRK